MSPNRAIVHILQRYLPRSESFIFEAFQSIGSPYKPVVFSQRKPSNQSLYPARFLVSPSNHAISGHFDRLLLKYLGRSPALEQVIHSEQAALLHAHFGQIGAQFLPVALRSGRPLITSFYGKDLSVFAGEPSWRKKFDALWQHGARFIALGPSMRDTLITKGCPEEKVCIVPIAADLTKFPFTDRSLKSPTESANLISVGRLVPKKGFDILIRALAKVSKDLKFSLKIIGDGPEKARLQFLVQELSLGDLVEFAGWVPHDRLPAALEQADIFILASRDDPQTGDQEGTPTVLIEAQASGLPVIATFHADIPFIVQDRESGILVQPGNIDELHAAIEGLLRARGQWVAFGRKGRENVKQTHDKAIIGRQLMEIYSQCLT